MFSFKNTVGVLLFIGVIILYTFKTYNTSKANEEKLEQKLNIIDSKINVLETEIRTLTVHITNNITTK